MKPQTGRETPTPRTDAECFVPRKSTVPVPYGNAGYWKLPSLDFARQLELELADALKALEPPSDDTLKLHMGELSAQEIRAIHAYCAWKARAILGRAKG